MNNVLKEVTERTPGLKDNEQNFYPSTTTTKQRIKLGSSSLAPFFIHTTLATGQVLARTQFHSRSPTELPTQIP